MKVEFDNLINHKTGKRLSIDVDKALYKAHRSSAKHVRSGKLVKKNIGGGSSNQ